VNAKCTTFVVHLNYFAKLPLQGWYCLLIKARVIPGLGQPRGWKASILRFQKARARAARSVDYDSRLTFLVFHHVQSGMTPAAKRTKKYRLLMLAAELADAPEE
jgi:hypothetical protein